jgi:hypothetical protein
MQSSGDVSANFLPTDGPMAKHGSIRRMPTPRPNGAITGKRSAACNGFTPANMFCVSVVGRYVSVVRSDDWFDGGAHGNQHADTILWDNVAHKCTNIRALFTESADNGQTMTALARGRQARGRRREAC